MTAPFDRNSTVSPSQRFTRDRPCPICHGWPGLPQGKGVRCWGFVSSDGTYGHCTRSELAGPLEPGKDGSYAHLLAGACRCGREHGLALAPPGRMSSRPLTTSSNSSVQREQLVAAALSYAERGWAIFPVHSIRDDGRCDCNNPKCQRPGKHPWTRNGLKDARTDEAIIRRWWAETYPGANIGWAVDSGHVVVDVDEDDDGKRALAEAGYHLPPTVISRTGEGWHYFYRAAQPVRPAVGVINHVDFRGEGSFIILPPSRHVSGRGYEWSVGPDELDLADAPAWVYGLGGQRNCRNGAHPDGAGSPIPEGARNATLTSLAGTMRRPGMMASEIEAALLVINTNRCQPPLDGDEVRAIAASVGRYPPAGEPAAAARDEWEPPVALGQIAVPVFPTRALPDWLAAWVQAEATATQTPPDLAGWLALDCVSTATARKAEVLVRPGWREPVNIFTLVVLPPGSRKSAVFRDATAPIGGFEASESSRLAPDVAEAGALHKVAQQALERAQRDAAAAGPSEREAKTAEVAKLARQLTGTRVRALPRLVVDDCTPERLATLLAEQDGRLAVLSPEGGLFEVVAGRYSDGPNFGVLLNGHAGDDIRVDRVNRPPDYVRSPALTVGLAVQPDVLRGLLSSPGFRGRGLLARFLYALPPCNVGQRKINPPSVPAGVAVAYRSNLLALLGMATSTDESGQPRPHTLTLSPAAAEAAERFERWLEPRLAPAGELGSITDWGAKLAGAVARLAGLLHLAEHALEPVPWRARIDKATMLGARSLGLYLIKHAQAAFMEMGADKHLDDARHLLGWIERSGCQKFSKREAHQANRGRLPFKLADDLDRPLALLCAHGYIAPEPAATPPGPGRRPSPGYLVNPWLTRPPHTQNPQNTQISTHGENSEYCEDFERGVEPLNDPPPGFYRQQEDGAQSSGPEPDDGYLQGRAVEEPPPEDDYADGELEETWTR